MASEALTFTFWVDKSSLKMPKNGQFLKSFWKPEAGGQTKLPDRSFIIGKILMENAKGDILSHF